MFEQSIKEKSYRLTQSLDDWAIDGEAGAAERRSSRSSGDQAVLRVGENLELFTQLLAIALGNGLFSPRVQVRVPGRAVIESECRNPSQCVVRPVSIVQVSRESLTLRIITTFRAVGGDEDAFDR